MSERVDGAALPCAGRDRLPMVAAFPRNFVPGTVVLTH